MQIEIFFTTDIDFVIKFDDRIINVGPDKNSIVLEYTPKYHVDYNIEVECLNKTILSNPITLTKIVFDDFWALSQSSIKCKNIYDPAYVIYAESKNIPVDVTVTDNNTLFFMGSLLFSFYHPIHKFWHNEF